MWTVIGGGDTQTLLAGKTKFEFYALSLSGDAKTVVFPNGNAIPSTSAPYEPPGENFTVLLPPANEVCKGYVFTPVCQSFCSQGEGSASVHGGIPPHPWQGRPPWQGDPPGKADPPCAMHAGRYGQQAGDMHPTGMQFLFTSKFP